MGILAWKDPQVLVPALQIAEILMEKLPGTFSKMFVREGVVHAVDSLIITGSTSSTSQQSSHDKDNDSIPGSSSSRSRRNRRRGANSSSDANPADDTKSSMPNVFSSLNSMEVPVNSSLRAAVIACAKAFKEKYFPVNSGSSESGVADDLFRLKNLSMKLILGTEEKKTTSKGKSKASFARFNDFPSSKEETLVEVITEMLQELSKREGVSTFEFIGSGVVSSLLGYFTCGYFSKGQISEVDLPKLRQQALGRYKSFVSVALPSSVDEGSMVPMSVLVQRLQSALSSLERFPVMLSHSSQSSGNSTRLSSGIGALSQPLKLRLCRAKGEKSLRDYSSNVVLIDPLASLAAVEDFLWPRVQRSDSGQKPSASAGNSDSRSTPAGACIPSLSTSTPVSTTRRHSTRSKSSTNIDSSATKDVPEDKHPTSQIAKGKAILKSTQEGRKGPQTRNSANKRGVTDNDNQMNPEDGNSSSEVSILVQ